MRRKSFNIIGWILLCIPAVLYIICRGKNVSFNPGDILTNTSLMLFMLAVSTITLLRSLSTPGSLWQSIALGSKFKCIKSVDNMHFVIRTTEQKENEYLLVKTKLNELSEGKTYIRVLKGVQEVLE